MQQRAHRGTDSYGRIRQHTFLVKHSGYLPASATAAAMMSSLSSGSRNLPAIPAPTRAPPGPVPRRAGVPSF